MKGIIYGALLAILSGCATVTPPAPDAAAKQTAAALQQQHTERVSAFNDWQLHGRMAVQRGDKGFSADLLWRQTADAFDIRVMAPLNGGTFALVGDAEAVVLVKPKGETFTAADPETLMRQHLGWALPVAGARNWVRGLLRPGDLPAHAVLDDDGRWTDFDQDGWRISILEYTGVDGLDLPKRLFLTHDDLKVRIFVKQWERRWNGPRARLARAGQDQSVPACHRTAA